MCWPPNSRAHTLGRRRWTTGLLAATLPLVVAGYSPASVSLADGKTANWSEWGDRHIVLNYWAEWCAPCRHEIPELNRLHHDAAGKGTVVLGVNYDGITGERLTSLIERMGIEFPVLIEDPRERWGYPRPDVLPATVLIGRSGEVRAVLVGPQTRESILQALGTDD